MNIVEIKKDGITNDSYELDINPYIGTIKVFIDTSTASTSIYFGDKDANRYRSDLDKVAPKKIDIFSAVAKEFETSLEETKELLKKSDLLNNHFDLVGMEPNDFWHNRESGTDIAYLFEVTNKVYFKELGSMKNLYYDYYNNGFCNYAEEEYDYVTYDEYDDEDILREVEYYEVVTHEMDWNRADRDGYDAKFSYPDELVEAIEEYLKTYSYSNCFDENGKKMTAVLSKTIGTFLKDNQEQVINKLNDRKVKIEEILSQCNEKTQSKDKKKDRGR